MSAKHSTSPAADSIAALRLLTKAASEAAADPQEAAHPDHDIMVLSDEFVVLRKEEQASLEDWRRQPPGCAADNRAGYAAYKSRRLATKRACDKLAKLRPTTPSGLFAKAVAASRSSDYATKLGTSLALDLLESACLRAILWPAGEGKQA